MDAAATVIRIAGRTGRAVAKVKRERLQGDLSQPEFPKIKSKLFKEMMTTLNRVFGIERLTICSPM
jgi:hypothetical protein